MITKLPFLSTLLISILGFTFIVHSFRDNNATYEAIRSANGVAATFGLDRTGSPLSGGLNCASCHSGAFNNSALSITVKNTLGNSVTQYTPGETYSLEYNVSSSFGFARGLQSVILDGTNAQAGTVTNPGTNTAVVPLNNRQYIEQSNNVFSANSFIFTADWTAPAANTGDVTIYAAGIVGNGNNSTSGDDPIPTVILNLTEDTALNVDDFDLSENIQLYPNPSKGAFNLALGKMYEEINISISDINGKTVKTFNFQNLEKINFTMEVSEGIYFVKVKTSDANMAILKLLVD